MDNNIGKKLDGRYELLELIGVGGMADIYKAKDITEDRIVAVKIMKNEFIGSEDFIRRFRNESKAIALLSHPNIVKIFDVGFTEKLQFIVMEYIDGITLTEYIAKHGVLKWKDVVHFTMQILKALQHAHDRGIVHRDIKPQNVMLLEDGTIKVMDFGIARFNRETDKTMSEKAIGSVHYISPEQAKGDVTDERSDIYSIGVMMYEMLTGKKPFDGESPVSIALMHMQSPAKKMSEINNSIPEGLEEITEKAMQKEPSKRYQTAGEMVKDIEEFKQNPSIVFEYKYFSTDGTTKYFDRVSAPESKSPKPALQSAQSGEQRRGYALTEEDPDEDEDDEDEEYDDEVAPRRSPLLSVLFAVTAVFIIVAALVVYKVVTDTIPTEENTEVDEIVVPTLVGMTYDEMVAQYDNLNLKILREHNPAPAGQVIYQGTGAGTTIRASQEIKVTVSLGPQMDEIGTFASRPMDEAVTQLRNQGFITDTLFINDETVPANYVIRTDPPAGSRIEVGSVVTVIVSQGPSPTLTSVPDFVKLSEYQARLNAERNDIVLIVEYVPSEDGGADTGKVLRQSIEPNERVEKNTVVTVYVSNGTLRSSYISLKIKEGRTGKFRLEYYIDGSLQEEKTETVDLSLLEEIRWEFSGTDVHTYAIVVVNPETGASMTLIENKVDFSTDPPTKEEIQFNGNAFTLVSSGGSTTTTTTEAAEPPSNDDGPSDE
ncbi:MAG: Stk1 family PASTA domain-containing Ser/Thr kinase [Oscillospiraceae bacterium]|nr:Stk1 family PASTA domain-containing Ser/Thr kinase [Oscillospiraceae bacterium]